MPTTAKLRARASAEAKRHATAVLKRLKRAYPEVRCALDFQNPLQLLVATILSAQCTDTRVNIVTKDLFASYPDAASFANAKPAELERAIKSTGFFRNKAKNIKAAATSLIDEHNGQVPRDLDAMVKLAGVGRKTANVVLGTAFGLPTGVVVDTHVTRLSRRLGLTRHTDAVKIEHDLMALFPKREWIDFSHRLIAHGRAICVARKPKCEMCPLNDVCPRIGVEKTAVAPQHKLTKTKTPPAASIRQSPQRARQRGTS